MAGFWNRVAYDFDLATARIEAETAEIEQRISRLNEETEETESRTEQIRRETEQTRQRTDEIFIEAVTDIGNKIENAASAEERELLRSHALHLYSSLSS
jgi:hypothetical protein